MQRSSSHECQQAPYSRRQITARWELAAELSLLSSTISTVLESYNNNRVNMRFSLITSLSTLAVLVTVCLSQDHGVTTEPVDGEVIAPGESFPFSFTPTPFGADSCVYRPVEIYLSTSPPTREDAMPTATGYGEICILSLSDRSVVYDYGVSVVSPPGWSRSFRRTNYTLMSE